jgi:hypothetical protein
MSIFRAHFKADPRSLVWLPIIFVFAALLLGCGGEEDPSRERRQTGSPDISSESDADATGDEGSGTGGESDQDSSTDTDDESADNDSGNEPDSQLAATGTEIYNERCAGCHLSIDQSQRANRTAEEILAAGDLTTHDGLQWPNQEEAEALEAALAQ